MRKWYLIILMILLIAGTVHATPQYYTFTGYVTSMNDSDLLLSNAGYGVNSPVTYTFLVDFELNGSETYYSGGTKTFVDASFSGSLSRYSTNYFFADYISGSALSYQYKGSEPADFVTQYNYGMDGWSASYHGTYPNFVGSGNLWGNSEGDLVKIFKTKSGLSSSPSDYQLVQVAQWTEGTQVEGFHQIFGSYGDMTLSLTLDSISDELPTNPVPEPATMLLLGSGLVGLVGIRRRKFFRK